MFLGVLGHTLKQFTAQILVRHLAATEAQGDLYLVAIFQKLENIAHLDIIVVRIRIWTELDLFDLNDLLLLAGFGFALLRLVFELAEIHDLADGWIGIWRNLNQIKTRFLGHVHGTGRGDYADVFAVGTNQADFRGADVVIDARAGVSLGRRVMGSASDGGRPLIVHTIRVRKVLAARTFFKPLNSA